VALAVFQQVLSMNAPTRPPPSVLFIHDGNSVDTYISFLRKAGLHATETHADDAVAQALALKPDIIVLDFDCDGETMAALQKDVSTRGIPVIALADLPPRDESDD
jgi:DNA-binding response OmpR family regulator